MKKLSVFVLSLVVLLLLAAVAPVAQAQSITGDKVVVGEDFVLRQGETLDGNLAILGGTAQIENGATVRGDLSVLGGVVTIDGSVTGNVSLLGGSLQLNEGASIDGNLANLAGSVDQAPGAVVRGDTFNGLRTPRQTNPAPITPDINVRQETPRSWFARFINWQLGTIGAILMMGLLGLVLVLVAPRAVGRVASAMVVQPGIAFIFGFLTLILGVLAGAILLIACGLGLLVWLALVAAAVLGWVSVGLLAGQRLLGGLKMRSSSAVAEVLAGVVLITFLSRLPCIGWLFWLIVAAFGLGAVVMTRFGTQDADGTTRPAPRPVTPGPGVPPAVPTGEGGGSGGDFQPMPEPTDLELASRPIVPPLAPMGPIAPAPAAPAADEMGVPELPAMPQARGLTDIVGIDAAMADRLQAAGFRSVADVAAANPVELADALGEPVARIMAEDWIGQAQRLA